MSLKVDIYAGGYIHTRVLNNLVFNGYLLTARCEKGVGEILQSVRFRTFSIQNRTLT